MKNDDRYEKFADLQKEQVEDRDFRILVKKREKANVAVVAPHGGKVEPGTSELAVAIAGEELSLAVFAGIKRRKNKVLHITSENFDEPRCVKVVTQSRTAVAIHGAKGKGKEAVVYMGGMDSDLQAYIRSALSDAGFNVSKDPNLQGESPDNICNRGKSGHGVQLELTRGLRSTFSGSRTKKGREQEVRAFYAFVKAVRAGLRSADMF